MIKKEDAKHGATVKVLKKNQEKNHEDVKIKYNIGDILTIFKIVGDPWKYKDSANDYIGALYKSREPRDCSSVKKYSESGDMVYFFNPSDLELVKRKNKF